MSASAKGHYCSMQTKHMLRALSNCPWHTSRQRQVKCYTVISPCQAAQNPPFSQPQRYDTNGPDLSVPMWSQHGPHSPTIIVLSSILQAWRGQGASGNRSIPLENTWQMSPCSQDMDFLAVGPRDNLHSKEVFTMIFTFKEPGPPCGFPNI